MFISKKGNFKNCQKYTYLTSKESCFWFFQHPICSNLIQIYILKWSQFTQLFTYLCYNTNWKRWVLRNVLEYLITKIRKSDLYQFVLPLKAYFI